MFYYTLLTLEMGIQLIGKANLKYNKSKICHVYAIVVTNIFARFIYFITFIFQSVATGLFITINLPVLYISMLTFFFTLTVVQLAQE